MLVYRSQTHLQNSFRTCTEQNSYRTASEHVQNIYKTTEHLKKNKRRAEEEVKSSDFENSLNSLDPDSAAERIYTSGTTGPPKAVVLTHKNIEWTARAAVNYVGITSDDLSISYLPLSHVAEQVFTILGPAVSGNAVYFAESFDNLVPNLQTSRPTIFFGVPRVWEKVHETLSVRLSQATGIRLKLVQWAMSVSRRANRWQDRGIIWDPLLGLQYVLAKILLKKRVKVPLGFDRLRMAFTGAAPISSDVAAFFAGLDIPLNDCLLYTSPSPRDGLLSRMPSSA